MAIELIQGPLKGGRHTDAGVFSLPVEFNSEKYASQWVKKGHAVEAAGERQHLVGTKLSADGWKVWKDGETPASGKPFTAHTQSGEYVLLFRPREIQDAVNAIFGNLGKERMMAEKTGETTGGVPVKDPGLFGNERLNKLIGTEDLGDGDVVFNSVPDVKRVTTSALELSED